MIDKRPDVAGINSSAGRKRRNREQTAIENSVSEDLRNMVGQMILARICLARGEFDCYQQHYAMARESAESIKLQVDQLFDTCRGDRLDDQ